LTGGIFREKKNDERHKALIYRILEEEIARIAHLQFKSAQKEEKYYGDKANVLETLDYGESSRKNS
jgi:isocitrate/isopropylmalate dehydrogenase